MKQLSKFFSLLLSLLFFCSCAGGYRPALRSDGALYGGEYDRTSSKKSEPGVYSEPESPPAPELNPETGKNESPSGSGDRLQIFFGSLQLRVGDAAQTRSVISEKAVQSGGYVESIYERYIIIRVPRDLFTAIFNEIMNLGEVVHKAVETLDVTEAFQDLNTRLSVAEKARERLYALLESTTDVEQRLKILKEIKRLTEEIELINLQLDSMKRLMAFSRITVELIPRLEDTSYMDKSTIPFPWISRLNPLYTSLPSKKGQIKIVLGDDFAVFNKAAYFLAETADGIRIRIGSTANFPKGDAVFWQQAVAFHLAKYYQDTARADWGTLKIVLFKSRDQVPFYYLVGIIVKDDDIYVVEVFFPDQNQYENKIDALKTSLESLRID